MTRIVTKYYLDALTGHIWRYVYDRSTGAHRLYIGQVLNDGTEAWRPANGLSDEMGKIHELSELTAYDMVRSLFRQSPFATCETRASDCWIDNGEGFVKVWQRTCVETRRVVGSEHTEHLI